ncbi:cytochrome P450 [Thozetella sp. PMI_491]|nr:cytochrome P450 [Thozetella sp. PMI_491]
MVHAGVVATAFLAGLAWLLLRGFWSSWQRQKEANRLGCRPPPRLRAKWPFGLDLMWKSIVADREMRMPETLRGLYAEAGGPPLTAFRLANTEALFTCDEEVIQAILAKQFDDFEIGVERRDAFFPFLGDGIFTQNGNEWRHSRALLRPAFSRQQMSDLQLEEKHVQNLMMRLPVDTSASGWTGQVDLQDLFSCFTLDSSSEYLFGGAVNSQLRALQTAEDHSNNTGAPAEDDFTAGFDKAMEGVGIRGKFADLGKFVWPPGFQAACKVCHRFMDDYVGKLLGESDKQDTGDKYLFLEALAAEVREPIALRSQLLNVLLAARDTTAGLLGWIFYCLARDPARYQKLREAVLEQFGDYSQIDTITFESLKGCKYLQYVIDETLRLYPSVPINSRFSIKDTTLPRGGGPDGKSKVYVPKGTAVTYSVYIMHRRKELWGEDAEDFIPERWEGRKVGWEFLPFNGGPRICLGQQFALTKVAYMATRLVQRFDKIENLDPVTETKHKVGATMSSGTGVIVRLRDAGAV